MKRDHQLMLAGAIGLFIIARYLANRTTGTGTPAGTHPAIVAGDMPIK